MHEYISKVAYLPHRRVRVPPLVPNALAQMMQSCASFSWAAMMSPEGIRDQQSIGLDSCDNPEGYVHDRGASHAAEGARVLSYLVARYSMTVTRTLLV